MTAVLDSSITLAWVYPKEVTPAILNLMNAILESGGWVPGLWKLEVANILELDTRRGRHPASFRDKTLADLEVLPIYVDPETAASAWKQTLQLAIRRRLTLYDAAYLELALRRHIPLATLDKQLGAAAMAEGVKVFGCEEGR